MRASVGKGQDVAPLHQVGHVGTDEALVARQNGQRDGAAVQLYLQVSGNLAYLDGIRLMLVLNPVRGADDGADADCRGETRHSNTGGHVRRAVV